jgi:Family of unknown function (DUF6375)
MKIWTGYGSEHSMNLVMIGTFKDASAAQDAKDLIDALTEHVQKERPRGEEDTSWKDRRFSEETLQLLRKANFYNVGSSELEQFMYDVRAELKQSKIVLTTDEIDVSAFLKLLLDRGARVEVYSAHEYPDTEYGR